MKQEAHQLVGQATKIRPKAVAGGIFGRFLAKFDNCVEG